jgi:Ion channel
MLRQVLVAAPVCICTIVIHALVMTMVVRVAQAVGASRVGHAWFRLTAVMIATVSVLMLAHVSEVLVWAATYALTGAAPEGASLVYFAFVNYATLGYGDITPVPRWLLLGPITALNGILLSGWSTAVIFEVLRRTMESTGLTVRGDAGAH